ncbi:hypothetical protein Anapl_03175 [Anas platyrhynchos]|uniref:Uncharacterized protein n=1 Tax=Anas platyrhynchos TaxID=8839 RepID=R0LLT2_ANAPL|nr:hypothetical protein Anapl_03175 [Anas platyrhynchos]
MRHPTFRHHISTPSSRLSAQYTLRREKPGTENHERCAVGGVLYTNQRERECPGKHKETCETQLAHLLRNVIKTVLPQELGPVLREEVELRERTSMELPGLPAHAASWEDERTAPAASLACWDSGTGKVGSRATFYHSWQSDD